MRVLVKSVHRFEDFLLVVLLSSAQQMALDQPIGIDQLFLAGIFPGLLMLAMLSIYSMYQPRNTSEKKGFDATKALAALNAAKWEIPLPIIVLGGGTDKLTNEGGLRSHNEWCFRVDRGLQTPH